MTEPLATCWCGEQVWLKTVLTDEGERRRIVCDTHGTGWMLKPS